MFSEECAEAILKRQLEIDTENLHVYEITLVNGQPVIWMSTCPPNISSIVQKNTDEEGTLRPCVVTTEWPYFQQVRVDCILSIREILNRELEVLMAAPEEDLS